MNLSCRAILSLNFVEEAPLTLVSKKSYVWNHFDTVEAYKHVCKEREISSKTMCGIFMDFLCGRLYLPIFKALRPNCHIICKTKLPFPCSRSLPGIKGQFKRPLGAFVTYCNISC